MKNLDRYTKILQEKKSTFQLRSLRTIEKYSARYVWIKGQKLLNFSSNDYLGLADQISTNQGIHGSGASPLVSGHHAIHQQLEDLLSQWKHQENSILLPAGYMANLAAVSTLAQKDSLIFYDKLCHASLIDGMLLSGAKFKAFRHLDYAHLEELLENARDVESKIILTDSVFSMDGDLADLKKLSEISKRLNALLIVDEAHGTGVYGETGAGLAQAQNIEKDIDVITSTFSKALGTQGGSISANTTLIDYLINHARAYIFSTSLSPTLCQATIQNILKLQESALRQKLWQNIDYFKKLAKAANLNLVGDGPIQPIIVGSSEKALQLHQQLLEQEIFMPPIRFPAVAQNSARLRLTLTAAHEHRDIEQVIESINKVF